MMKIIVLCCLVSVSLATYKSQANLKKLSHMAKTKNLGYTYVSNQPSYENNNGGSYGKTYNQDKYNKQTYSNNKYPADSQYMGEPQYNGGYNGQYEGASQYNNGKYNNNGEYMQQGYTSTFAVHKPKLWTELVVADPAPVILTPEQKKLIMDVNAAFAYTPYLYGAPKAYGSDYVVNSNYDYSSYGNMDFRYFAPRNEKQSDDSSTYSSKSNYLTENPTTYNKEDSYKSKPYESKKYAPKEKSYPSKTYKTASYNDNKYPSASYSGSGSYSDSKYPSASYSGSASDNKYPSASYSDNKYPSASYSGSASYNKYPSKQESYNQNPRYNSEQYKPSSSYEQNEYRERY